MAKAVIKVEEVSKKFTLSHEAPERYVALRDVIAKKAKGLFGQNRRPTTTKEDFYALKDVSFEINKGDRVGIIGRNGAGKSTLLKILSRITEPSGGRITINGRVASLLEVGTGFHPELSGRENIFLNGAILGMSRQEIRSKFDEIVNFAEVSKFLDTPVKRYSSGMYVRLAFAVAAHLEPEILIVDEVLAVGDAQFQKKCLGKMEEVSLNEGRTVLFVSHNMNVIRNLCTTSMMLAGGKIVATGETNEVIQEYLEYSGNSQEESKAYHHKTGSYFARINNIDVNGKKNPLLSVFEEIIINISIEIRQEIKAVEFFVIIYNTEGLPVLGLFQKDDNETFDIKDSAHEVSIAFQNNLTPGKYFISAGMFDSSRQFVDWVEHAETFEVESSYLDGRLFEARLGMTTQKTVWERVR
jgi:lipopolysaccharide transport system ATP-binding protein